MIGKRSCSFTTLSTISGEWYPDAHEIIGKALGTTIVTAQKKNGIAERAPVA